jgi:hypothetical protein
MHVCFIVVHDSRHTQAMELYLKNNPDVARKAADRAMAAASALRVAGVRGPRVTRGTRFCSQLRTLARWPQWAALL